MLHQRQREREREGEGERKIEREKRIGYVECVPSKTSKQSKANLYCCFSHKTILKITQKKGGK